MPSEPLSILVVEDDTEIATLLRAALQGMPTVLKMWGDMAMKQAIQRQAQTARNVAAGRDPNWGMPLFRESVSAA